MRRSAPPLPLPSGSAPVSDWATLARLAPYLWRYRWRVVAALLMLTAGLAFSLS